MGRPIYVVKWSKLASHTWHRPRVWVAGEAQVIWLKLSVSITEAEITSRFFRRFPAFLRSFIHPTIPQEIDRIIGEKKVQNTHTHRDTKTKPFCSSRAFICKWRIVKAFFVIAVINRNRWTGPQLFVVLTTRCPNKNFVASSPPIFLIIIIIYI